QQVCVSRHDDGAAWAIDEWIIGGELYKSYQDPPAACDAGYPYTVTEAHIFLQIATVATITVGIDIETPDTSYLPGCPVPGETLYLGNMVNVNFPGAGLYDLVIELETPQEVTGPFFVGFFFATSISPDLHLSLVTDDIEAACVSYNIWDTALGYIDLGFDEQVHQAVYSAGNPCYAAPANDPNCFDFDGRIILHTAGILSGPANCCATGGDVNNDAAVNVADLTTLVKYIFNGGTVTCLTQADANADGSVNVSDLSSLVGFLFSGGPAPQCGPNAG
ncbi:MAG TPA: dockerin type I repeat-containing protein, partial [candidate division Zixibacteria bacterium]|nr:dockerin type I repeat-containing protein [candidate division Zixibacteria bacterium]